METPPALDTLPNELLNSILSHLPTASLLPLATVSHHFHSVILRILEQRLNRAVSQPDHRLMLECYHPSERLYTPYLYCNYLHTDSFSGGLGSVYSHFRPVEQDDDKPRRARRARRQGSGGSNAEGQSQPQSQSHAQTQPRPQDQLPEPAQQQQKEETRPSIDIYLDEDESFAQLCAITNLVRLGPKPGLFRSHVNVGDGVIRVWRDWLAAQAQVRVGSGGGGGEQRSEGAVASAEDGVVLWADAGRDVGVRFRVTEKDDVRGRHQPVLVGHDEQLAVAYRLEFEELLVRSSTLLVMMDRAEVSEGSAEGRAIVLASF